MKSSKNFLCSFRREEALNIRNRKDQDGQQYEYLYYIVDKEMQAASWTTSEKAEIFSFLR